MNIGTNRDIQILSIEIPTLHYSQDDHLENFLLYGITNYEQMWHPNIHTICDIQMYKNRIQALHYSKQIIF